jgi:hypothetical protein
VHEQRPGWEVIADVDDGRRAFEVALEKRPDVAILGHEPIKGIPFLVEG